MSQCLSYCLVGSMFLGSMLMTMLANKNSKKFTTFKNLLNDDQKQIYKSVMKERANIYIQGLVLGIVVGLLLTHNIKLSKQNKICVFVVVSLFINHMYYVLYPKSTYMLKHLTSTEQNVAWLNIYKEMKLRCAIGVILGLIGYILLGMGWCE